ncbi:MAG: hypothetical protein KBC57_12910 [Neisseriaceae bacterium]|nr:hypothetical protein [Neisseriaceae bacterium]
MKHDRHWCRWLPLLTLSLLSTTAQGAKTDAHTQPGTVLSLDKGARGTPLPDAGENYLITYVSQSAAGLPVSVTGQIAIPRSPMPSGGYPVLSWASGTTGMGQQCAPSNMGGHTETLNEWVKRGYAVLRTDYPGWADLGPRPLLNQRSNASAVIDLVTAAHAVSDQLATDWIVAGHSEGGGAALWAGARHEATQGRFQLKAAIALAPVGPGL